MIPILMLMILTIFLFILYFSKKPQQENKKCSRAYGRVVGCSTANDIYAIEINELNKRRILTAFQSNTLLHPLDIVEIKYYDDKAIIIKKLNQFEIKTLNLDLEFSN